MATHEIHPALFICPSHFGAALIWFPWALVSASQRVSFLAPFCYNIGTGKLDLVTLHHVAFILHTILFSARTTPFLFYFKLGSYLLHSSPSTLLYVSLLPHLLESPGMHVQHGGKGHLCWRPQGILLCNSISYTRSLWAPWRGAKSVQLV